MIKITLRPFNCLSILKPPILLFYASQRWVVFKRSNLLSLLLIVIFFRVGLRIFSVNSRRVFTTQMTCEVLTTLNKRYKPFHKLFDSLLAFVLAIKTQKKLTSTSGCCQEPQSLI